MTNTILLRRTLQANATFSLVAALDLVLFGRQIASVVGAIGPRELTILPFNSRSSPPGCCGWPLVRLSRAAR